MYILTPNNSRQEITQDVSPDQELYFNVLDYSDEDAVDYFFHYLVFLDEFVRPTAVLRIGDKEIELPYDWSILICDKHSGIVEPIEIAQLNGRIFHTWGFNPIDGYMPSFREVELLSVGPDRVWTSPRLKNGNFLTVPIEDGQSPDCIYAICDLSKVPEELDITTLI